LSVLDKESMNSFKNVVVNYNAKPT